MSRVRGTETGIEIQLRRQISKAGFRYRKNHVVEGIKVDLAFPRHRMVVFIDGCFWHGCPRHYTIPGTRKEFWQSKLRMNVERDRRQTLLLEEKKWRVFRIWEHEVRREAEKVAEKVCRYLGNGRRPKKGSDWRVVRAEYSKAGTEKIFYLQDLHDSNISKQENMPCRGCEER
jgi:DNA mismatch endonuclease, patch repair protein